MEAGGEEGHQGEEPSQSQGTRLSSAHPSTAHAHGHSQPQSLQTSAAEGYGVRDTLWTSLNTTSFLKDQGACDQWLLFKCPGVKYAELKVGSSEHRVSRDPEGTPLPSVSNGDKDSGHWLFSLTRN